MDQVSIKMEDFMDVVYRCKFCPYSCTQSPDMGVHVRDIHLSSGSLSQQGSPSLMKASDSSLALALDVAVSEAVGKIAAAAATGTSVSSSTISSLVDPGPGRSNTNFHHLHESEEVLGFTSDAHAFLDKVSFTPMSIPSTQTGPMTLSNTSTPDLTELINLVKPSENNCGSSSSIRQSSSNSLFTNASGHLSGIDSCHFVTTSSGHLPVNDSHLSSGESQLGMASVVQLQQPGGAAPLSSSVTQPFTSATVVSGDLDGLGVSQPYTVMAIHLPHLAVSGSNTLPHYVVSTPVSEPISIPEHTETKEFLLCGLCKLAFTTMEECQSHMQSEHKELMQCSGVSIGVQAGGAKRGRKRKADQVKFKEIVLDTEDMEWLPSVTDNNRTPHPDGRMRRKVKPPRALKEDFVLGKRLKRRIRESGLNLGYKIACPMMSCKAKFKTEMGLHTHMSCHNLDDTAFTCKECQAPHEFWKQLRMHLWRDHRIDCDLFSCDQCDYKTDTHHKMNIHKEIHTDSKPYTCDVCGKGFRQASQMKNHQVTHVVQEGKEARKGWFSSKTCDICDRAFANSKCLKNHKAAVHSTYKPYECMYCSHTTARKAMMELHIRTHTGEKPFKCDICSYSTGDHNSMRRHKMRHTGQKQYRCTQCPYTCIQSISLKQHMRHKHPGTTAGIFQCSRCPFRTINQEIYSNHVQDHKKGLIPDKVVPQRLELPKAKRIPRRLQAGSAKRHAAGQSVVETLLMKHPQFHAVLPGEEPTILSSITGDPLSRGIEAEVFNMQVTMLPDGDTQISADDMNRLSESPCLLATGVSPLQLIYSTLSTISEQGEAVRVGEGKSALLTAELIGGIHTAILSSMQDGVTVHSVTYHIPKIGAGLNSEDDSDKVPNVGLTKGDDELMNIQARNTENINNSVDNNAQKLDAVESGMGPVVLQDSGIGEAEDKKSENIFYSEVSVKSDNPIDIVNKDSCISLDSPSKMDCINRSEKLLESSVLREMLECKDKVSFLNTQDGMVNFITVDFLDSSIVSATTPDVSLGITRHGESESV
ncbi:unnamed protein product [Candidula unifasciata]|uniref:C2H2-type domain-containing protein n=1 Tax=Candidula unifasciata TaxID=100452 RepID=A0A8S3YGT3_9EUPU|nr:unnamed protein product [Candidula unifasciata]